MRNHKTLVFLLLPEPFSVKKIFFEQRLTVRISHSQFAICKAFWQFVNESVCSYHVTYTFQSESRLYLLECQGTPCLKQARYLKFK